MAVTPVARSFIALQSRPTCRTPPTGWNELTAVACGSRRSTEAGERLRKFLEIVWLLCRSATMPFDL